ncbi:hypothetical protein D3C79_864030 [compost metagenome]
MRSIRLTRRAPVLTALPPVAGSTWPTSTSRRYPSFWPTNGSRPRWPILPSSSTSPPCVPRRTWTIPASSRPRSACCVRCLNRPASAPSARPNSTASWPPVATACNSRRRSMPSRPTSMPRAKMPGAGRSGQRRCVITTIPKWQPGCAITARMWLSTSICSSWPTSSLRKQMPAPRQPAW